VRRRTHLRGSQASAVTGARCVMAVSFASSFSGGMSSWWWHSGIISCTYGGGVASFGSISGQEAPGRLVVA
jgi:hypothetical protein